MSEHDIQVKISADASGVAGALSKLLNQFGKLESEVGSASKSAGTMNHSLDVTVSVAEQTASTINALKGALVGAVSSMGALNSAASSLSSEVKSLGSSVNALGSKLGDQTAKTRESTDGLKEHASAHKSVSKSMIGTLGEMVKMSIVGSVVYSTVSAIGQAMKDLVVSQAQYMSSNEQNMIAFTTLIGNEKAAKVFYQDLVKVAADTPFELPQLAEATKKMLAFGFAARDIKPMMMAVGNATSALGGSPALIERIVLALGQMKAKGRVQGDELLQLAEAGIPAYQILQEKLKLTSKQVQNIGKASINADVAIKALVEGMNERYAGMMEKQSNSMQGMLSTIKDNIHFVFAAALNNAWASLEETVGKFRDFSNKLVDAVKANDLGSIFKDMVPEETYEKISKIGTQFEEVFGKIKTVLSGLASSAGPVFANIGTLILNLLPYILKIANGLMNWVVSVLPLVQRGLNEVAYLFDVMADHARFCLLVLAGFLIIRKYTLIVMALEKAFLAVRAAVLLVRSALVATFLVAKINGFIVGLANCIKMVKSLRGAFILLGATLKKVSRGNIFTFVAALGIAIVGDKIFDLVDKLTGAKSDDTDDGGDDKGSDDDDEEGRRALEAHNGTPTISDDGSDAKDNGLGYWNKIAEGMIRSYQNDIKAQQDALKVQITDLQNRAELSGGMTADDNAKLQALQLRIKQLDISMANFAIETYKGTVQPHETDKTNGETQSKIEEWEGKLADSTRELNQMVETLGDTNAVINAFNGKLNALNSSATDAGDAIVKQGEKYLGAPYQLGGPGGFGSDGKALATDCAQFIKDVFSNLGYTFGSRGADDQYAELEQKGRTFTDESQLRKGDLVFYHTTDRWGYTDTPYTGTAYKGISHVGIYIGNGQIMHASSGRQQVMEGADMHSIGDIVGFGNTHSLPGLSGSQLEGMSKETFAKDIVLKASHITDDLKKAYQAMQELFAQAYDVKLEIDKIHGNTKTAAINEVDNKYMPLWDKFVKAGWDQNKKELEHLMLMLKGQARFDQSQKDYERAGTKFQNEQKDMSHEGLTPAQINDAMHKKQADYIQSLKDIYAVAEKGAKASENPDTLQKLKDMEHDIANKAVENAKANVDRLQGERDAKKAEIDSNPDLSKYEKDVKKDKIDTEYAPKIAEEAKNWERISKEYKDLPSEQKAKNLERSLANVGDLLKKIRVAAKEALYEGLEEFFEKGIFECKSLGDAFRNLAISILQSIQKINAQAVTADLMGTFDRWGSKGSSKAPLTETSGSTNNSTVVKKAAGGLIRGPGSGTSDSIDMKASNGEYVFTASAVRTYGTDLLDGMNKGIIPKSDVPRFATGGLVGKSSSNMSKIAPITAIGDSKAHLTIVNVDDPDQYGKYLNSVKGTKAFVNHVKSNAGTYRKILNMKG